MLDYRFSPSRDPHHVDGIIALAESAVRELGIDRFTLREPSFWRRVDELEWVFDGAEIDFRTVAHALRLDDEEAFYCVIECGQDLELSTYLDGQLHLKTAVPLTKTVRLANDLGYERLDYESPVEHVFETSPHPRVDNKVWNWLKRNLSPELYILEVWQKGSWGNRLYRLHEPRALDAMRAHLKPRSLLYVIHGLRLMSASDVKWADVAELCACPDDALARNPCYGLRRTHGPALAIVEAYLHNESKIVEWLAGQGDRLLLPAAEWYARDFEVFVLPDADGVVRSRYFATPLKPERAECLDDWRCFHRNDLPYPIG